MTTESDRELLELAAKAAGHKVIGFVESYDDFYWYGPSWGLQLEGVNGVWNALEDDGDALRLAVKLKLNIMQGDFSVGVNNEADIDEAYLVQDEGERLAVLRRAITRAAASIGRGEG